MKEKMKEMTNKQVDLIMQMNEFCDEYFDLSYPRTVEEAGDYILRNIEGFNLSTIDSWQLKYL